MSALQDLQHRKETISSHQARTIIFDGKLAISGATCRPLGKYIVEGHVIFASGVSWMDLRNVDDPEQRLSTFVCFSALNCRREKGVKLLIDELRTADSVIHMARAAG